MQIYIFISPAFPRALPLPDSRRYFSRFSSIERSVELIEATCFFFPPILAFVLDERRDWSYNPPR